MGDKVAEPADSKVIGQRLPKSLRIARDLGASLTKQVDVFGSANGVKRLLLSIYVAIRFGTYHGGMAVSRKPLLAPGNEAEWAKINRAEAEHLRASNLALTPPQRLELGQELSQQAVSLLVASVKAGNVPRRALWS
jgi:hypothetical protein